MHKQLTFFADTLMVLELAPPTQRLMMWKTRGGVDTLLSSATQDLIHTELKMVIVFHPFTWVQCLATVFPRN